MPAKPQTQDGLRNKGGRLLGFSRGNSDAEANYNVPAPKQAVVPTRSDTPAAAQDTRTAPTREEIAKDAKIQTLTRPRKQTPGPPPQPPASWEFPKKDAKKSPVKLKPEPEPQNQPQQEVGALLNEEDLTTRALFEGSQLGDDFMNSRITTPRNEPVDLYQYEQEKRKPHQRPYQTTQREASPELGHELAHHQHAQRRSSGGKLQITDGRVVFSQGRDHRRERSSVRDGFSNEPVQERHRQWDDRYIPASPAKSTRDLPIRGVKIKAQKKEQRPSKQRQLEPSPYEAFQRQPTKTQFTAADEVIELDDDSPPIADTAQEETPKQPRRIRKQPQETLMESAMPPPSMNWNRTQQQKKRARTSVDYDDQALSMKTFDELLKEPFDLDPAQAGNDQGGDGNPLSNKLDRFVHQSEDEQRDFFERMPMNDWEESGDWLVDRFADLMKRMKDARREKRKIVSEFEQEASQREEAVRLRSDGLDRKMDKMRKDGLRVVGERQA